MDKYAYDALESLLETNQEILDKLEAITKHLNISEETDDIEIDDENSVDDDTEEKKESVDF
jgi:hypothetical protein